MQFTQKLLKLFAVALVIGTMWSTPAAAQAEEAVDSQDSIEGFVTRAYEGILGRQAEPAGFSGWVAAMQWSQPETGESYEAWRSRTSEPLDRMQVVERFLESPEFQTVISTEASADFLEHLYREVFDRAPDSDGFTFWMSQLDQGSSSRAQVVLYFIESAEMLAQTNTVQFVAPLHWTSRFSGYVDAGHGVFVPKVMLQIRFCESANDYQAANRRSSARGAYQFLKGSWDDHGHREKYGVIEAHNATKAQQDEAAVVTFLDLGTRPWNESRDCWGFAA